MARTHLERRYALLEKLAELTPKMRHAQRESARHPTSGALKFDADDIAAKVDRVVEELAVLRGYLKAETPSMFD